MSCSRVTPCVPRAFSSHKAWRTEICFPERSGVMGADILGQSSMLFMGFRRNSGVLRSEH